MKSFLITVVILTIAHVALAAPGYVCSSLAGRPDFYCGGPSGVKTWPSGQYIDIDNGLTVPVKAASWYVSGCGFSPALPVTTIAPGTHIQYPAFDQQNRPVFHVWCSAAGNTPTVMCLNGAAFGVCQ